MRTPSLHFTRHAIERATQRGIPYTMIHKTIDSPYYRKMAGSGVYRYVRDSCCVVAAIDSTKNKMTIITCYNVYRSESGMEAKQYTSRKWSTTLYTCTWVARVFKHLSLNTHIRYLEIEPSADDTSNVIFLPWLNGSSGLSCSRIMKTNVHIGFHDGMPQRPSKQ